MKHKLISLILVAATLLALTACGNSTAESHNKTTNPATENPGASNRPLIDEISPDFEKFVGEWKTLDDNGIATIIINPNMTMSYNDKTIKLEQISPTEFTMETPLEVEIYGDILSTDRCSFGLTGIGLYELYFHFQRDASIGYGHYYFRSEDYVMIDLNTENMNDYVEMDFYTKCERNLTGSHYIASSGIDLDPTCAYIFDLEITYNGNTIYRPVTFEKGRRPDMGEITQSSSGIATIKAEHPFSSDTSYVYRNYITLSETEFSTWPENYTADDVCFIEVDEIVAISGKVYTIQKLPADDPNHIHFYDSEACFDDQGNSWTECECGEKSVVTKSDEG